MSYTVKSLTPGPFLAGSTCLLQVLDLELTERCNHRCVHCYINRAAGDFQVKRSELTTGETRSILSEAVSLGARRVRFTGGEALLRQDFEELYLYARRLGLRVLLFTSATLMTPRLAKLFAGVPPLAKIELTLFGMKKNSYEAVTRTPGSFNAAQQGIRLLLKYKVPFIVKGALLPGNKHERNELEAWASTLPGMRRPLRLTMFFNLRARREDGKNRLIQKLRMDPREGIEIATREKKSYLKNMKRFCSRFIGPQGDRLFACGAGLQTGCVDAYGLFQPCMLLRHPETVYPLKKGSLREALTEFFPKLRERKATHPAYLARCARCFLKGLCEQCPAKSWMEHGTLDTPVQYSCDIAHTQARFLGLLKEGENAWEVTDWKERIRNFIQEDSNPEEALHETVCRT